VSAGRSAAALQVAEQHAPRLTPDGTLQIRGDPEPDPTEALLAHGGPELDYDAASSYRRRPFCGDNDAEPRPEAIPREDMFSDLAQIERDLRDENDVGRPR